jgi:hypothetical protein
MAEFDYSSDIAPLKGNYFRGSIGMSQDEVAGLELQYLNDLTRQNAIAANNRKQELAIRNAELSFRQQQFELEQKKDIVRLERESLAAIPEVTKALTSIMDDPSLDDSTKISKVAELKFQYAGPVTYNKTTSNLFSAAEGRIQSRKAESDRTGALAYALAQTGQADAVRKLYEGKSDPLADEYITAADAISSAKMAESKRIGDRAMNKELMKRETSQQTARIGTMNSYMDTLRRLAPPESKEVDGMTIGTLGGKAPTTGAVPQAQPFKFATEDRIELEEMMRDLNPMLENEDLSKYSDENLYRSTVRSTTSSLRKLSGLQSGFRSDKFLTTPPQ